MFVCALCLFPYRAKLLFDHRQAPPYTPAPWLSWNISSTDNQLISFTKEDP